MDKTDVYRKAVRQNGPSNLIFESIKGLYILQKRLCDLLELGIKDVVSIREGIATAEIVLEQLVEYFHCRGSVDMEKQYQIEQLAERLGMEVEL